MSDSASEAVAELAFGPTRKYIRRFATRADVPALHAFYLEFFRDVTPAEDRMLAWIIRAPRSLSVIHATGDTATAEERNAIAGSYKTLPLNNFGVSEVEAGRATGSTLDVEHLAADDQEVAAWYVGDVAARNKFTRGGVLGHLLETFQSSVDWLPIYARPYSDEGLLAMTRYGFVGLGDAVAAPEIGQMCVLRQESPRARARRRKAREL